MEPGYFSDRVSDMGSDRVSQDRLLKRVEELYSAGDLDYNVLDYSELAVRYETASKEIKSNLGVLERREWSSYGCGFASFLESWFYRTEQQFEAPRFGSEQYSYRGVIVLFSLLEPMFAVGESEKQWSDASSGGVLPSFQSIDQFESSDVRELSQNVCRIIRQSGIPQVSKRTLSAQIDSSIDIESNISDGPLLLFDAFFHWMD